MDCATPGAVEREVKQYPIEGDRLKVMDLSPGEDETWLVGPAEDVSR